MPVGRSLLFVPVFAVCLDVNNSLDTLVDTLAVQMVMHCILSEVKAHVGSMIWT